MDLGRIPTLSTARLRLRPLAAADLDAFAAMQADPEVMRHLGGGMTRTREETWTSLAAMLGQWPLRGYGMFALEETATGRFAGRAGLLHPYAWPGPELAYGLDRAFWGRGYATEAAVAIRAWAFGTLGLDRLISYVRPANAASVGVLRKLRAVHVETIELLGGPAEVWEHRRG
jgi:RimJ/RimL family protein N-acetyltransferase